MDLKRELVEPDPERCQTMIRQVSPWRLGIPAWERCRNKPVWIATEVKPGDDGRRGSGSMCQSCADQAKKMLGEDFLTFKAIEPAKKEDEPRGMCQACTTKLSELRLALNESLRLQCEYAGLLNQYDMGKRIQFQSVEDWIARLRKIGTLPTPQRTVTPMREGFYWATSVARPADKKWQFTGQRAGLRWVVRVFMSARAGARLQVQVCGRDAIFDLEDYRDYEGPLGIWHDVSEPESVPKRQKTGRKAALAPRQAKRASDRAK
jgi:hypothetical protein